MEEFPSKFSVQFEEFQKPDGRYAVRVFYNGRQIGDELNDNAHTDDGYRYHDAFHFIYQIHTGKSLVIDKLMTIENNEDQPKNDTSALPHDEILFEEMFSVVVFASRKELCENDVPNKEFIAQIMAMSKMCGPKDLSENVIKKIAIDFYRNFDLLYKNKGGTLICDTALKTIEFNPRITPTHP